MSSRKRHLLVDTIGLLLRAYHRLRKDYEALTAMEKTRMYLAMSTLMLARLYQ